ncbi:hypothetical protein RRU01S_19_00390 [Agrobacterium rubi TR3 = NBRC 13261]|uniref:Uncharacterized protein n=1 Tax=Agrobacterium rubi TR3 = NBRC 13261 TaxID=1368415 RepID=A0A081CY88_9HYPH|nr:hypothetical protein [Agrobacterium rubi]GAK71634.1 hypothetical protein RRU01S_19_00390 [Agrobacterium rubi TR3 = NBRC 13261]
MDTKERVLDIRYVCMRSDFIAVTRALIRRPFWQTVLKLVLSLIIAGNLFVMAWFWPVKEGVPTCMPNSISVTGPSGFCRFY